MTKSKQLDQLKELPQRDEVWAVINRSAPVWVEDELGNPYRPRIMAVLEGSTGVVRYFNVSEQPNISAKEMLDMLHHAMRGEMPDIPDMTEGDFDDALADQELPPISHEPYRPGRVVVEGEHLADALRPELQKLNIESTGIARIEGVDEFMRDMTSQMAQDRVVGLARIPGMSAFNVQEFYAAAAHFYEAAPWKWLSNLHLIEFRYSADDKPVIACIMGNGREEFGISLYETLQQFEALSAAKSPKDAERVARRQIMTSVTFGAPWEGPTFEDLDDIERYGYPVAGEDAYPIVLKVVPPTTRVDPTFEDVSRYSAIMRALPEFVTNHMDALGKLPRPAEATLPLPDIYNGHTIQFRFPVIEEDAIRTPDMEARGLVDEDSLAAWLVTELKARAPFEVRLSELAVEHLRGSSLRVKRGQKATCLDVHVPEDLIKDMERDQLSEDISSVALSEDTGDFDGLMCAIRIGKETILIPLMHIDSEDPNLPLRREISAYQFERYCNQADEQVDIFGDDIGPEVLSELLSRFESLMASTPPQPPKKRSRKPKSK